jgi:GDP-D-mannose dehydratase
MDDYVVFDQNYIRKKQIKIYGNNQKLISIGWKPKFNAELLVKDMLKMEKNYGNTIS